MKRAIVCWIIKRTAFNVLICLNDSWSMNKANLKGVMKNQDLKGSFFKIQEIFTFKFSCKFCYFLDTKISKEKKIVQYLLRFMYLFCRKICKNYPRKSFIKKLLSSILYVLSFSVHI